MKKTKSLIIKELFLTYYFLKNLSYKYNIIQKEII